MGTVDPLAANGEIAILSIVCPECGDHDRGTTFGERGADSGRDAALPPAGELRRRLCPLCGVCVLACKIGADVSASRKFSAPVAGWGGSHCACRDYGVGDLATQ